MPRQLSILMQSVKDFLSAVLEAFATGGVSLITRRSPKTLRDVPYKLIFEIAQTIIGLAAAETMAERRPLMHQLAEETELVGRHGEDIFILLNCPSQLRVDFKRAIESMRHRNLDSQLTAMYALFQALAWHDPHKARPKIERSRSGRLAAVTPSSGQGRSTARLRLRTFAILVPVSGLLAFLWGLLGTEQNRYLAGSYFLSWGVWFVLLALSMVAVWLDLRFIRSPQGHRDESHL